MLLGLWKTRLFCLVRGLSWSRTTGPSQSSFQVRQGIESPRSMDIGNLAEFVHRFVCNTLTNRCDPRPELTLANSTGIFRP